VKAGRRRGWKTVKRLAVRAEEEDIWWRTGVARFRGRRVGWQMYRQRRAKVLLCGAVRIKRKRIFAVTRGAYGIKHIARINARRIMPLLCRRINSGMANAGMLARAYVAAA